MPRIINIFTLGLASWALAIGIVVAVWHILDDRSTDIAVPDGSAIARHDPNPPMMAWRPRIPDSVGTTPVVTGAALACKNSVPSAICSVGR